MKHQQILFQPIGTIRTPYIDKAPYQPFEDKLSRFEVEVYPEFEDGLNGLDSFRYLMIFFYMDKAKSSNELMIDVSWAGIRTGVFSTRSPERPNPIGFSVVKLESVKGNILHVKEIDILDGTPLLDIKPCVPEFDFSKVTKTGWLEKSVHKLPETRDDGRFIK